MAVMKVGDPRTYNYIKPNADGSINANVGSNLNVNIGSVVAEIDVSAFTKFDGTDADGAQILYTGSNWVNGSFIPVLVQVTANDASYTTATAQVPTLTTTGRLKTQTNLGSIDGTSVATGSGVLTTGVLRVCLANNEELPSGNNNLGSVAMIAGTASFGSVYVTAGSVSLLAGNTAIGSVFVNNPSGYGLGSQTGTLRVALARDANGLVLPVNYMSPVDGTGSFGTGSTILCAGWPFTVDDANCIVTYVQIKPSGGSWEAPYVNGMGGIGLIGSNNEIRMTGATPFAASDTYRIGIRYQDKAYTTATDSLRTEEIDPINEKYVEETLGSQSYLGSGTTYYPGSSGMSMAGYKDLSLQWYADTSATGSTQIRVYASNDLSSPPNQWINITPAAYCIDTNTAIGLGSIEYKGGTIGSGIIDFDNLNVKSVRVQVDNLGSVCDYFALWMRRKA